MRGQGLIGWLGGGTGKRRGRDVEMNPPEEEEQAPATSNKPAKKSKTKVEKVYSPETQAKIDAQGALIRSMKESGKTNDDAEVAEAVKILKELKA
jgi:hypothetical protein